MSGDGPRPWAALSETHSGVVVLLGERAYKLKKPVDLGFLDFSTREQRLEACTREVELNRRLAPDVYLGVADLVGPDGAPVDHLVMMRRMPAERRLSHLVRTGTDVDDDVREVARTLAAFHARATRLSDPDHSVTAASLRRLWRTSLADLRGYDETIVPREVELAVENLVERYLEGRTDLFERRRLTGAVVDGHGDLMAEDVFCLDDGPRILDCLEFDDRLRVLDEVDDAAFLAMDLELLGAPELAARFLGWYEEFSGDVAPVSLVEHYVAYRAVVRAKVACVRRDQGHLPSGAEARRLLDLASEHLERAAVTLVLVGGAPGTGKSTLAGALADRLGMTVLSSDRVRKELAGLSAGDAAPAEWGEGLYTEEWSHRVDEELLHRAGLLLRLGESVVVDSTWSHRTRREAARRVAIACTADLVELECRAPTAVAEDRIRGRRGRMSAAGTRSDAGVAVAQAVRESFDPWPTAAVVDTTAALAETVRLAVPLVRPRGPRARSPYASVLEPD